MLTLEAQKTRQNPQSNSPESKFTDAMISAAEVIPAQISEQITTRSSRRRHSSLLGDALTKISQMSPPPLPTTSHHGVQADQRVASENWAAGPDAAVAHTKEMSTSNVGMQSLEVATEESENASDRRGLPRRMGRSATRVLIATIAESSSTTRQFHGEARTAQLADLCMTSAAIMSAVPYAIESRVRLRFESPELDAPCDRSAKVVRLLQLGHDRWKVVCQLDRHLDHTQLASLSMHVFESHLI